ncbi:MAG TPA: glycosyltransferase [Chloroflexota bacterium]|nr:glycosyltransferase [Chloroflexota bacterium]
MSNQSVDPTLSLVPVGSRAFSDYRPYASAEQYDQILDRARGLKGLRVVEVNSTPKGGGVATMLHSVIPTLQSLQVDVQWYSMNASHDYFSLTKKLFDMLQGEPGHLPPADQDRYCRTGEQVARALDQLRYDVLVIHCPQPLGAAPFVRGRRSGWIWRGHIDLSHPNPDAVSFLAPFLDCFQLLVLEVPSYQLARFPAGKQRFVPDGIDPQSLKNRLISREQALDLMRSVGIDTSRPTITQIARFDPLKNPIGVVEAYRKARRSVPSLQLAMLGTFGAEDDPTARQTYERVKAFVGDDPDIHLYTDPKVIGQAEVDAFQTGSDAVLLFSKREGFGIAATEAMWKCNAVIAGAVGGLCYQIVDGNTGFLVSTVDECAERIVRVVQDRELARRIGDHAHRRVAAHFLLPRLIGDWLELFGEVASARARQAA